MSAKSGQHGAVPGHARRGGTCLCGWLTEERTKRAQIAAYDEHMAPIREQFRGQCKDCLRSFSAERPRSGRESYLCRPCSTARFRAWRIDHRPRVDRARRNAHLVQKYGITIDDYEAMLEAQGGLCAICGQEPTDPRGYAMHVDHSHADGRVRGLLCDRCNRGLGYFADDPDRLVAAAAYLLRESACVS